MDTVDVVHEYFRAINAEDWDAIGEVFQPDGVFSTPGARPRQGRDEIVKLFRGLFSQWETHVDTPGRMIRDGDTVVVEIGFEGRSVSGADVSFDALDVFKVRDGRLESCTSWFDSLKLHRAISGEQVAR